MTYHPSRAAKKAAKKARHKATTAATRPVKKAGRAVKRKVGRQVLKGAMALFSGYRADQPGITDDLDPTADAFDDQEGVGPGQRDGFDPLDRLDDWNDFDRKRSLR